MNEFELEGKFREEKRLAREYQERKHDDWNETYELFRNKVRTNQLVQRQAVNVPLMKETVKTLVSKIDDAPQIDWEELSGDEFKEIVLQEKWNKWSQEVNLEGVDIQDKKTTLLYGRAHKKLNWTGNKLTINALDPFDVVIDPLTDPLDIETARYIIHQNIFRPLRDVLASPRYSDAAKAALKKYKFSQGGIIQSGENKEQFDRRMERLLAMGVQQEDFATFSEGDAIVNLTEHITHIWNNKKNEFERYVIVYADDEIELMREPLKDVLGVDFYPYVTWSEDIETQDYYTDSIGDLVRVPNKILNIWYSQMVENRTLGNFNMHWFDSTVSDYTPQTYEPGPGRMLPAPGNPRDTIMPVAVSKLDDNMNSIEYVTRIVERATSANAIDKGVSEKSQQTLGEVQILLGKSMERTVAMAKFYRRSYYELATKWYKMLEANQTTSEMLYRTDSNGKVWPKKIYPSDWKSKAGYNPIVRSTSEQETEKTKELQKLIYIKSLFQGNKELNRIMQSRSLEMINISPAELRAVEEEQQRVEEEQAKMAAMVAQQAQVQGQQQQQQQSQEQNLVSDVQNRLQELNQVTGG